MLTPQSKSNYSRCIAVWVILTVSIVVGMGCLGTTTPQQVTEIPSFTPNTTIAAPSAIWQGNLAIFNHPALGLSVDVPGDWYIRPQLTPPDEVGLNICSSPCIEQAISESPSCTQIEISPGPSLVRNLTEARAYVRRRGFIVATEEELSLHGWEAIWFEISTDEAATLTTQPSAYMLILGDDGLVQVIVRGNLGPAKEVVRSIRPIGTKNTTQFELGGHVYDWDFPHAVEMHYAGMNWAKVQVFYDQDTSGIIEAAHARGFKVQLTGLGSPDRINQPDYKQNYANWVAALAAAGADAIEVWNEPNIKREWQSGHISPQAYTEFLCTAYAAIKAANADTAVISAAPAPTGFFGGCGPTGCDDIPWLQGLYEAGAVECIDYIGAHHNAGATSPSERTGRESIFYPPFLVLSIGNRTLLRYLPRHAAGLFYRDGLCVARRCSRVLG
jgi:hypothetical protein